MVPVDAGVFAFCIDRTEVTQSAYDAFLSATTNGGPARPDGCTTKKSNTVALGSDGTMPVRNVDWCDAYAYCAWAGKRLCGRTGGGGAMTAAETTSATGNEWHLA